MRLPLIGWIAALAATPAAAAEFKVVTTFTVIADMARQVAGDHATVVSVTRPGAEVHGYEPTPRDLVAAMDADLLLWNGLNLEHWFEQFLANLGDLPAATLIERIAAMPVREGGSEGKPNPHAWMSAENAAVYIDNIAAALSAADPENAAAYAANATAYKAEVAATIAPLRDLIATVPEPQRWLVTCEGAFSYLARDLGLQEAYLWPINADEQGTPQQVRRLIDLVRKNKIPAVFSESTISDKAAKQVARETGAKYGGVLYVDSLSDARGAVPTYLKLLEVTVDTIAKGFGQ